MINPGQVAVTGASGFIGQTICVILTAAGWKVRALVRSENQALRLDGKVDECIYARLDDSTALQRLVKDCEAVVHCAGSVRGSTQQQFDRVNVTGLHNLLNAIGSATQPAKLLVLSSLAAREPKLSFYAASKKTAEELLERQNPGLRWIALRPPAVYGPGDTELLPLFRMMAKGIAPVPGNPKARFSMIHVDDLASAVLAWLECANVSNGVYTLHDGCENGYNWKQVCDTVSALCDRKVRQFAVPPLLLDVLAVLNRWLSRVFGYAPMLTPEKLRELRHPDWVCDNRRISEALRWEPALKLRDGLQKTPGWCSKLSQTGKNIPL